MGEVLLAADLDTEATERLGGRVVITHDGPRVFLYARDQNGRRGGRAGGQEADRRGRHRRTRGGHPLASRRGGPGATRPSRCPRPTPSTRPSALRHEAAELEELAEQGTYDWEVRVELPGHRETVALRRATLRAEGLAVTRRWRYLLVGALTEQDAKELAARILEEAPEGSRAELEPVFDRTVVPALRLAREPALDQADSVRLPPGGGYLGPG